MKRIPQVPHVPDRPLDAVTSIKVKLATLIVGAVGITVFVFWFGVRILHVWPSVAGVVAAAVALLLVRRMARGMTSPLREMAEAAQAMAKGDYSQRVTTTSHDEVGRLATAFNRMADRARRDRSASPGPRREREPRAAHAIDRAPGHPREPRRRGR